ncbi:hypothetical protein ES703_115050 [subsurface metagenome]
MMTQKGRIVYDRKKDRFSPKDLARVIDSYSKGASGRQFGEFVARVLELVLVRQPRVKTFAPDFWGYFLDKLMMRFELMPLEKYLQALGEGVAQRVAGAARIAPEPPPELTPAELKREVQKRGL